MNGYRRLSQNYEFKLIEGRPPFLMPQYAKWLPVAGILYRALHDLMAQLIPNHTIPKDLPSTGSPAAWAMR